MAKLLGRFTLLILVVGLIAGIANAADVKTGLVGYWPLDGDATDHSGEGNDGEVIGDPAWVPGHSGQAIKLAGPVGGETQNVLIPDFSLTSNTVTWAMWINGSNNHDWTGIMMSRGTHSTGMGFGQGIKVHYTWAADSTWQWHDGPAIPLDTWAMVAISLQPTEATAYVYTDANGLQSATNVAAHPVETIDMLSFGWDTAGDERWFSGIMDEALIYNRALSEDDILQLAVSGASAVEAGGKLTTTWGSLKK